MVRDVVSDVLAEGVTDADFEYDGELLRDGLVEKVKLRLSVSVVVWLVDELSDMVGELLREGVLVFFFDVTPTMRTTNTTMTFTCICFLPPIRCKKNTPVRYQHGGKMVQCC